MADKFSKEVRSSIMSKIRSTNTKPELKVQELLAKLNVTNIDLHRKDLPGKPDFTLGNKALFIHGCFWHRHKNCRYSTMPKSNVEFWVNKFDNNMKRDKKVKRELKAMGYDVMVLWECQLKQIRPAMANRLKNFFLTA